MALPALPPRTSDSFLLGLRGWRGGADPGRWEPGGGAPRVSGDWPGCRWAHFPDIPAGAATGDHQQSSCPSASRTFCIDDVTCLEPVPRPHGAR